MNKYLYGTSFNIPMVSVEVPEGSLQTVNWTLKRIAPDDLDEITTITGTFLAVDNPTGAITLDPVAEDVGTRSIWRLEYALVNTLTVSYPYVTEFIIEATESLVKGDNSFQSYWEALLTAEEVSGIEFFKSAPKEEQIAALISSYEILCTMVFADRNGDHYNIGNKTADELDQLEPAFLRALRLAQVLEANEMLDRNSIHYKRQDGLMSETIGESSMMFRPGNIQNFPITRRSMNFLRNYVVIRARLYRA